MKNAYLEHTNLTVPNPEELASLFCRLFDWKIRWSGSSLDDGRSVHVGSDDSYLALYTHENLSVNASPNYPTKSHLINNNLNHLGIVVSGIDEIEAKVKEEGFEPFNHGDYEPGRRFYFMIDELEVEIIDYT